MNDSCCIQILVAFYSVEIQLKWILKLADIVKRIIEGLREWQRERVENPAALNEKGKFQSRGWWLRLSLRADDSSPPSSSLASPIQLPNVMLRMIYTL